MLWTRVGYAGGAMDAPTYQDLGDHSEALEVGYDPAKISYEELLTEFWRGHAPSATMGSRQYRSALFVANEEERAAAERSVAAAAAALGRPVHTAVEPLGSFWQAEDYHQKYRLRREGPAWKDLRAAYPDVDDLVKSTAATRLNAWSAGLGDKGQRKRELRLVGLSEETQQAFR